MARVVRSGGGLDYPHLTHKALWMIIAASYAETLRRLELYGFYIRIDSIEMMLRYLTKLEACRIIGARPFDPSVDIYDEEEPKERFIARGDKSVKLKDFWDYSKWVSGWFDTPTVREFEEAKDSHWPLFVGSAPYTVPLLHTLRLDVVDLTRLHQFSFPRLRHLDMTVVSDDALGLYAIHDNFPASISHLMYAGRSTSFAQLFHIFPHLRQLTMVIEFSSFPSSEYKSILPHPNLEVVEMASWDRRDQPQPLILDIINAVRARKLPNLRMIKLTPPRMYHSELPCEECEALGITLEVVVRPKPPFYGMAKRHHA